MYLKHLRCVVSGVHRILVGTRIRVKLAPIHGYGNEGKGAVRVKCEAAVLPLHYSLRAFWVGSCTKLVYCPMSFPFRNDIEDWTINMETYDWRQRDNMLP